MLAPSRLARGPWLARSLLRIRYGFPQRPLCELISASLGRLPEAKSFFEAPMGLSMDLINGEQYSLHTNSGVTKGHSLDVPVTEECFALSETLLF
jgi:hypothetical protein